MSENRAKAPKGLIVVVAALQVALGLLLAGTYLSAHNSLHNNGNWTSTKTTLAGGLMGAESFVFDLQSLALGRLNLSAWHGFQEVVSKSELDPAAVEFKFAIKKGAHLTFEINRTKRTFTGVRMSAAERFPPGIFRVTVEGEHLTRRPFRKPTWTGDERWHTLRVEFEDEESFTVFLDNKRLERFPLKVVRPQRIGFRGGLAGVFVKDVRVTSRSGTVFSDDFQRPANWLSVNVLAVAGTLLFSVCLYLLLRRVLRTDPKLLLFYFLMFSVVLIISGLFLSGINWHRKQFYPDEDEKVRRVEASHIESGSERMISRIEEAYSKEPDPGVQRILFVGSSQTFGAGAARRKHIFTRRAERLLNERSGGARRFECLNVAVEGYRIADMRRDLVERWIDWKPDVVIVNAGNNNASTSTKKWEAELMAIVEATRQADSELVLIPEANSMERIFQLAVIHGETKRLAQREGLPLIEMHEHLSQRADDGFLWWDWVHLTSFGHELFAEHLVDELARLDVVDLDLVGGPY